MNVANAVKESLNQRTIQRTCTPKKEVSHAWMDLPGS